MASPFDLKNWNQGKVTLFQAFGLTGAAYPQLSSTLTSGVALYPQAGTIASDPTTSGTGAASSGPTPHGVAGASTSASDAAINEGLGQQLAASFGWGSGPQWQALNNLVQSESGWNSSATNSGSGAYGIGQFLNTTWATVGYAKTSDPKTQILAMLTYIKLRYGNPQNAWAFHKANGYY